MLQLENESLWRKKDTNKIAWKDKIYKKSTLLTQNNSLYLEKDHIFRKNDDSNNTNSYNIIHNGERLTVFPLRSEKR